MSTTRRRSGRPRLLAWSCACLASLIIAPAFADDWTSLGGNARHDGRSADTGPAAADLAWQTTSTALFGGPMYIAGDRLVTMRFRSISVAPIVCHDLATGAQLWSVDFAGANSRSVPRGVHDGRVIATNFQETQQDTLVALDLATGARLWTSPVRAPLGIVWTACFTDDGDVVLPCAGDDIARLDATDGHAVWTIPRTIPNTGAEAVCVHGPSVYGFEGTITTPKVLTAWDLATGARRYSSPPLPGDGDQEIPPTIAPDGTIYVKRDGGLLYALVDDGTQITIRWSRPLDAYYYSGHLAVGHDGSIYCPDATRLLRLDPANGGEIGHTASLIDAAPLNARMVVDAVGTLFVGNSGATDGRLFAFAADLTPLWSTPVSGMTYGGPALGGGGYLAVSGGGTTLQVFRSAPTAVVAAGSLTALGLQGAPNPCQGETTFRFALPSAAPASLTIYDVAGRVVRTLAAGAVFAAGEQAITWDGRDEAGRHVGSGVYLARVASPGAAQTTRVQVVR